MTKTTKRAPKLRFNGFDGAWEEKKLKDVASIVSGGTPSTSKPEYWNGHINWFAPAEIGEQKEVFNSQKKITDIGLAKSSAKILPKNKTILFTSRAGIGNVAILRVDAATNQGFQSIVIDENKTTVDFLFALIPQIKQYAIAHAAGSTFLEISGKELSKATINMPSYAEQQKIGALFSKLDDVINLNAAKCDNLKQLKKAMLQKMFPKKGQTTPEVRFKGFDGEWEEKKLGEISSLITKGTTPRDKSGKGEINFIKVENIDENNGKITSCSKITRAEHENYLKRSQLKEGDILFSIAGTLGRIGIVQSSILPANTNQALSIIRINKGNIYYISTALRSNIIADFIQQNPTMGAQPNLSLKQIRNLKIPYPSIEEQQKIGATFAHLDDLIAQQSQKCAQLGQLKKALLQQMFA